MASCFRTVSNRLCCSTYLKTPAIIHLDANNASPSKITQYDNVKKSTNNVQRPMPNCISNPKYCCNHQLMQLQNSRFPLPINNITSQDIIMWYKRENGLLPQGEPITSEALKDALLLIESAGKESNPPPTNCGRPTEEKLTETFNILAEDLPKLFVKPLSFQCYHQDIVLENHIRGNRTVGLGKYVTQLALLKAVAHFKFATVKFVILKITKHPEEGTIKCRWRITGINGFEAMFQFWKFIPGTDGAAKRVENAPTWYDGFSIYHVGSDGKIFKHVIDKMMPDDDKVVSEKPGITKLAMYLGLAPSEEKLVFMNVLNDYLKDCSCLSSVMLPLEKLQ